MKHGHSTNHRGTTSRRKRDGRGSPVISGAWSWGTNSCVTGKRAWQARADAKAFARLLGRQGKPGMNAYRCTIEGGCGLFHIGHLPGVVRSGEVGRSDYYGADS